MLAQQDRDKPGLYQKNRDDGCDLPPIPLPHRWLAEQDFAPRWKAVLADAPALHLPQSKATLLLKTSINFCGGVAPVSNCKAILAASAPTALELYRLPPTSPRPT